MISNRSNSERGKAFDIDTKIEYMNKLYEVRESNSCCDCSLATICSSSNISAGDRNDEPCKYFRYYKYIPMIKIELDENKDLKYFASLTNIKKI